MKRILFLLTLSFFTCDAIIEVDDISNANVTVLAPVDEAIVTDANITFSWEAVEDAEQYKLQIATPSFQDATQIITDSLVVKNTFSTSLNSGNYEWRIRAENSGYATIYATQKFKVSTDPPLDISGETVVITSPADNASFSTTDTINFSWNAINGADEYTIEIVTPNFENPTTTITNETLTETSTSKSNLSAGNYQWRVKAKNVIYGTVYTIQNFTI